VVQTVSWFKKLAPDEGRLLARDDLRIADDNSRNALPVRRRINICRKGKRL
jgi:hypothetical protein